MASQETILVSLPPEADAGRASFERDALVHLDALYRSALRLAGNAMDADDLVQTAIFNAYRGWHRFQPGTNAKAWLLKILRHVFINEYRRRTSRRDTMDVEAIESFAVLDERRGTDPEAAFFERFVDGDIERALAELPMEFREVVDLVDVEGLRYEEAADILAIPVGTVKSRLSRARKLLQTRLAAYAAARGWVAGV